MALVSAGKAQNNAAQAPPLSGNQTSNIERWAKVYGIPSNEALEKYRYLIGNNYEEALAAWQNFDKKNAFEIAAAALIEARQDNIAGTLLYTLERKKEFSPTTYGAAIQTLEGLNNVSEEGETNGEHLAGIETLKSRLATLISRWLGIPDPELMMKVMETKPGYRKFIAQAKQKAATITNDSPY